jgi:imidazole glycerol-phosphate synthase subunit HisH
MRNAGIVIVDDGMGNLFNLVKAFARIDVEVPVTHDAAAVKNASGIVLPGVGAFEAAIHSMRENGIVQAVRHAAVSGTPILGICLGMQLLATESSEGGTFPGLDLVPGDVRRLHGSPDGGVEPKIPQMGWNAVAPVNGGAENCPLLAGIDPASAFYFLHSYVIELFDKADAVATCTYGQDQFPAIVQRDNVMGCQFHPERSGAAGLALLANFVTTVTRDRT